MWNLIEGFSEVQVYYVHTVTHIHAPWDIIQENQQVCQTRMAPTETMLRIPDKVERFQVVYHKAPDHGLFLADSC